MSKLVHFVNKQRSLVKRVYTVYKSSVSPQLTKAADKINLNLYRATSWPYSRLVLVVLIMTVCCVHTAHAKDLDTIITDIYKKFYVTYRGPICGVGVGAAGLSYWSSNPNGKTRAAGILVGTAIFAMVPVVLNFIATMTGTTDPTPSFVLAPPLINLGSSTK